MRHYTVLWLLVWMCPWGCETSSSAGDTLSVVNETGDRVAEASDTRAGSATGGEAERELDTGAKTSLLEDTSGLTDPPDTAPEEAFDATLAEEDFSHLLDELGPHQCPSMGEGFATGDLLSPLEFFDCAGQSVWTEDLCGARATWIYLVHAWCGECRHLSEQMEQIAAEYASKGVLVVQLLIHSYTHQLPTAQDCSEWQTEFQLIQAKTLHDPLVKNILLQESQQTGLSVFLDQDFRIHSKMNVYDADPIRAELDAILTKAE